MAGNSGLNCHLSEIVSSIIEPIAFEELGNEVDSTDDMLARIIKINESISQDKSKVCSASPECPSSDTKLIAPENHFSNLCCV